MRARWLAIGGLAWGLGLTEARAFADPETSITSDVQLYTDTDNVIVVSPQVGAHHALDDEGGEVSARAVVDAISAASADVVSSATYRFNEVRTEADLAVSKAFGRWLPSVALRYSREPDYVSMGATIGTARRIGGDTTLWATSSTAIDTIGRVDTPSSVFSRRLVNQTVDLAWTQNLDPSTVIRAVYSLTAQWGYLEKPYRSVPLFDAAGIAAAEASGGLDADNYAQFTTGARPLEEVPDARYRHAFGLRGLRYLPSVTSSLRLDYRLYLDSWGIQAHTVEPALYAQLTESLRLNLWTRFHWQSAASFWERAYVVNQDEVPALRSTDRSLSRAWHATFGARVERVGESLVAYGDVSVMASWFPEFLFLDKRLALIGQLGVRWRF